MSTASAMHQPRVAVKERRTAGRAARERVKRSALGRWERAEGFDPLAVLGAQNQIRFGELLPIRAERMALSQWDFYRGAAAVMAADLGSSADTGLRVQLCGDAHVLNFGLWATPERQLAFDLRDFDETLPGPFEFDVLRLAASIVVLAADSGLPASVGERAVGLCLRAYRERMARYTTAGKLDIWYDMITADQLVALFKPAERELASSHISRKARTRTSAGAARKLTEELGGRLRITDQAGDRFGVRALVRRDRLPQSRPAGSRREAGHPERDRHLRRLDDRRRARVLRAAVP